MIDTLVKFASTALVATLLVAPAQGQGMMASEATLCRSQLELLMDGEKLTPDEEARFEAQCDCLERAASEGAALGKAACANADSDG